MTCAPVIDVDRAIRDPNLLGAALGAATSWTVWTSVLRAAFGLTLSVEDRERFASVAGDRAPPSKRVAELWAVVSRRAGKTRMASALATHAAVLQQHRLAPGETGYVLLLAASKDQASLALKYIRGFLEASPILRQQIESISGDEIALKGNVVIAVAANSYRTVRGKSLLCVIADEVAYWRDESSAQPDVETYRACIPALVATGGMWIAISSGYRRIGLLFEKHRDHFGRNNDDVLVIQGSTTQFNPTLSQEAIDKAKASDPSAAAAEWDGGWRDDITSFLDDATVDAAIDYSRPIELPPRPGIVFQAFSDASGGRHDAFTVAIGHREKDAFVVDVIRGKAAPFDPQSVTSQFAALLKEYGISRVRADSYAAAWVETAWRDNGIKFERSELPKSQLYLESLPLFTRNVVQLPNDPRLTRELRLLERRTTRSGKDSVDHGRNGTDDFANSVCGLLHSLTRKSRYDIRSLAGVVANDDNQSSADWRVAQLATYIMSHGGTVR